MKELLECKDLLHNERVIKAYCELMINEYSQPRIALAHNTVYQVAFEMRDACVARGMYVTWKQMLEIEKPDCLHTAEDWIQAAVLCYEELDK